MVVEKKTVGAFLLGAVLAWGAVTCFEAWQHTVHMPPPSAATDARPLAPMPGATATVHSGRPNFHAVAYTASADGTVQSGIFTAEGPSTFDWHYGVDEAIYIHEGEVELDYMGRRFTVRPGDTVFFHAGTRAGWSVPKYVRKSWTIHEPSRLVRWWRRLTQSSASA